ncbi:Mannose or cellobiose epimerase, N-acyl-D-glucosamine 2-epimerase family [Paenibacillus sophorae]|uniref:AGE family epimerase/isomerase n=1 Tax=Paenibacillus sophorae TaxID=1333845 RepID=A0A1H8I195_9BACL|nr:AGE family epimerase/isomerase [Paenibacillus sophorae]QWU15829.1 AGE family epimerase/isomerase [Paenibacillus sophorae]SEN62490.1 Mannose or cellobiose epimerase, N-acyl-D-glucosamine 2-epimerase family [Paenibacillus sophorae]
MNDTRAVYPDFADPSFLKQHILDTVHFYAPRCIDLQNGGYINSFLDDGTISDYETKQLVGMTRFVYIFSAALQVGGPEKYHGAVEHGLHFLREYHWDHEHGGYHWTVKGRTPTDKRKFAYGHAFVLLAASNAFKAGISSAGPMIGEVYEVLEKHFWSKKDGLYADELTTDRMELSPYRGQNANMHLCEAMMAAYEATGDRRYLDRANTLAYSVMFKLLRQSGGLIWEHYNSDWEIDWNYNKDYTKSEYRPYGYIFGHSIEWSKLLLLLHRHFPQEWLLRLAERLFWEALHKGLDRRHGGIFFAMSPVDGRIIDADKSYWVMAESLGASAMLAASTGRAEYRKYYLDMFAYCWTYFVDHRFGGWYQVLDACNRKYSNIKSPPPKADYHPVTNCLTALSVWENAAGKPQ